MPDADYRPMTENVAYFQSDASTVSKTEHLKIQCFSAEERQIPKWAYLRGCNLHIVAKPLDQDINIKLKSKDISGWCGTITDQRACSHTVQTQIYIQYKAANSFECLFCLG